MTDSLMSSGEFSDLSEISDIVDNTFVVTPICSVCRKNYCSRVKPVTIQPCGHTVCSQCLNTLKDYVRPEIDGNGNPIADTSRPLCPECRGTIINDTPNYSLREITSNVNIDHKTGYWEKQISRMCDVKGIKIEFSRRLRLYAKPICMRIAHDETFVNMDDDIELWTITEKQAVKIMKNALIRCISRTNDDIDILCKWVGILSFTKGVERHLLQFFLEWYEQRKFLKEIKGLWIMDVITHPL